MAKLFMKKSFFLFALLQISLNLFSQTISQSVFYDGFWTEWEEYSMSGPVKIYGNYSTLRFYKDHPSQYVFCLTINDYYQPSKKELKKHRKSGEWFVYNGTIEYYISDDFMDAKSQFKRNGDWCVAPWNHDVTKGQTPCVKVTKKCKVKIAPYKKRPRTYNIWWDDVGYAIDLRDCYFSN